MNEAQQDPVAIRKKELRNQIKVLKTTLESSLALSKSEEIFRQVELLPEFKAAKTILAYWSLSDEVQTHSFVEKWCLNKRILLPLVANNDLELHEFSGKEFLVAQPPYGILEPINGALASIFDVDLVIVPGVAFDLAKNRMGRGKGYYDRLLKKKDVYKVGVCYSLQLVESVPTNNYDVPMNKIIYA